MPFPRSHTRSKSRSPAPAWSGLSSPRTPTFQPPSHYAAAAGLNYSNRGLDNCAFEHSQQHGAISGPNASPSATVTHQTRGHLPGDTAAFEDSRSPSQFDRISRLVSKSPNALPSNSLHRSSSKGARDEKGKGELDKRKSQMYDIPLLEMQLIPSLRDTVDRMTHPPTPVVKDVEDREESVKLHASTSRRTPRQPVSGRSPSVSQKYLSPSPATPSASANAFTGLGSAASPSRIASPRITLAMTQTPSATSRLDASDSNTTSGGTQRLHNSGEASQSKLKSALRVNQISTPTTPSSPASLSRRKSLRTIKPMSAKSPIVPSAYDDDLDSGHSRSASSKGTFRSRIVEESFAQGHSKSLLPVPKSKSKSNPNTPQDERKFPSFATPQSVHVSTFTPRLSPFPRSNLPRPAFPSASASESGSDLERRLGPSSRPSKPVASATVAVPSSSEGESDDDAAAAIDRARSALHRKSVIVPRDTWQAPSLAHLQDQRHRASAVPDRAPIGLGLQLEPQMRAAQGSVAVESEVEDEASVYDDEDSDAPPSAASEPLEQYEDEDASIHEEDAHEDAFENTPIQGHSDDRSRDDAHMRRQAALVGIVDGLRVEYGMRSSYGRNSIRNSGSSNYSYTEGVAITISDEVLGANDAVDMMAKRERVQRDSQRRWPSSPSSPAETSHKSGRSRHSRYLPQSATPSAEVRQHTQGVRSISRGPANRRSRHESVSSHPHPTGSSEADWHGQDEHISYQELVNAENHEDVAERERAAFGIPASLSYGANTSSQGSPPDQENEPLRRAAVTGDGHLSIASAGGLRRVDSNQSVDDGWKTLCKDDELSKGAEALFERLTVNDKGHKRYRGDRDATTRPAAVQEHLLPRVETRSESSHVRSDSVGPISITISSSAPSIYEEGPSEDNGRNLSSHPHSPSISWRSMLPPSAYDSLNASYGSTEMQRQELIHALLISEKAFVKHMRTMIPSFILPLRRRDSRAWLEGVPDKVAKLFDWLEDIVNFHAGISRILNSADSLWKDGAIMEQISELLRKHMPGLEVYQPYVMRVDEVREIVVDCVRDSQSVFGEYVRMWEHDCRQDGFSLERLLEKPINRVLVYPETFQQLLELTPRRHPDHFSTLSLLCLTKTMIHVLDEVRIREEEYEFVKEVAWRIEGLTSPAALARRERRLLHHGQLHWVRFTDCLSSNDLPSLPSSKVEAQPAPRRQKPGRTPNDRAQRSSRLVSAIHNWHVRRSGSVSSTASSVSSLQSCDTASSNASFLSARPLESDKGHRHRTYVSGPSVDCQNSGGSHYGSRQDGPGMMPVDAFVFTDLLVLTTSMPVRDTRPQSDTNVRRWRLLDGAGVSRIVSMFVEDTNYGSMMVLDLLPLGSGELNAGAMAQSTQRIEMRFMIPSSIEDPQEAWHAALRCCRRSTIHSISFPPLSGTIAAHDANLDLELDTRQSVMAILASGLPMPKSPSMQMEHAATYDNESTQQEREERGWWSLRFQQVLREMQRQDQCLLLPPAQRGGYGIS